MKLVYRNYKVGDDEQLAQLYNEAFHAIFPKNKKIWHWKYVDKPSYNPKFLNICEDEDEQKIVGFIAGEVLNHYYKGKIVKCGHINDVATAFDYQKRGISQRLCKMTFEYLESENIPYTFLGADPKGHAREKLYIPGGFRDLIRFSMGLRIISLSKIFFKDIKASLILSPLLIPVYSFLKLLNLNKKRKFLTKSDKKLISQMKNRITISHNKMIEGFYET